ncbi:MAG: PEGA domain-containing protein [Kofleriaceae bacterium]
MLRWLVPLALVAVVATSAAAEPERSVKVESTPAGAEIYLGDTDGEPLGVTPATIKLPPGEYVLILTHEGYLDAPLPASVPAARGRAAKRVVELDPVLMEAAETSLVIEGDPGVTGEVLIDGKSRGPLPARVQIAPGPHQVQLLVDGAMAWDRWIEVGTGAEQIQTISAAALAPPTVEQPAPPRPPRPPVAIVRVGLDVGWRQVRYDQPGDPAFTPAFSSRGLTAIRFEAEVAPWRLAAAARPLWPLVLVVGSGFAPADTVVAGTQETDQFWRTTEVGLRYRLGLGRHAVVGADAGWSRLLWAFRGDQELVLPDVDYQTVRLGLRGEGMVGPLTAWLAIENRVVASGGALPERFQDASADGFGLRLGGLARLWRQRLEVGGEYQLARMSWSFTPAQAGDYQAAGATDRVDSFRLWVGGAY